MKLVVVALAVLALAGCASNDEPAGSGPLAAAVSSSTAPATFPMTGTLTVSGGKGSVQVTVDNYCYGVGGYKDIIAGAAVTVYNADGRIVAVGALGKGTPVNEVGYRCTFPISVADIPSGQGPYQYEISHRGRLTVTEIDIRNSRQEPTLGS